MSIIKAGLDNTARLLQVDTKEGRIKWLKSPALWSTPICIACLVAGGALIAVAVLKFHVVQMAIHPTNGYSYKVTTILLAKNNHLITCLLGGGGILTGIGMFGLKTLIVNRVKRSLKHIESPWATRVLQAMRLMDAILAVSSLIAGGILLFIGIKYLLALKQAVDHLLVNHRVVSIPVGFYVSKLNFYLAETKLSGGALLAVIGLLSSTHLLATRTKIVEERTISVPSANLGEGGL